MENKLYRSRKDRMLFGVCGGLGKFFGIDSTIIRIIFVLLAFTGFGILAYIVIAVVAPLEESQKTTPQSIVEENVTEIKETATKLGMISVIHSPVKEKNQRKKLLKNKHAVVML